MERQDFSKLQTRKIKGLKRSRDGEGREGEGEGGGGEGGGGGQITKKIKN